ncbi:MAG: DNA methyltransferase [Bacilli bacterium]
MNNKLELVWFEKEKMHNVEPRPLIEISELSHEANKEGRNGGYCDNMLIHGDNLLALKSIIPFFAGKIKAIYIDPPYNTGAAFDHYNDNLEHSTWLSLMRDRIVLLKQLLSDDGFLFVQIDDQTTTNMILIIKSLFVGKPLISIGI